MSRTRIALADGGNVELVEIDGPTVYLRLQGACGSCPSSTSTMTMGIKRKLQESIPVRCIILPTDARIARIDRDN
jgi:Fe-S cluster biogenesis protein NfuA